MTSWIGRGLSLSAAGVFISVVAFIVAPGTGFTPNTRPDWVNLLAFLTIMFGMLVMVPVGLFIVAAGILRWSWHALKSRGHG